MPTYLEKIDDNSTATLALDTTGGTGRSYFYLTSSDAQYLQNPITDLLGYTNPFPGPNQKLRRTIPRTHPKLEYLYVSRITGLVGQGTATAVQQPPTPPSDQTIGFRPIANYLQYAQYEAAVEWGTRPYPILLDKDVEIGNESYAPISGTTPIAYSYAKEWVRYCDWMISPANEVIQGVQGSLMLQGVPGPNTTVPFTSPPWQVLPDATLEVNFYAVPLRWIISRNSYLMARNYRGRVNQSPFMNLFPAGSVLYLGCTYRRYSPPTGDVQTFVGIDGSNLLTAYAELADVTMRFGYTTRIVSGTPPAPAKANFIHAGFNALPNLADGKYYVALRDSGATPFFSAPLNLLFSDPDVNTLPVFD